MTEVNENLKLSEDLEQLNNRLIELRKIHSDLVRRWTNHEIDEEQVKAECIQLHVAIKTLEHDVESFRKDRIDILNFIRSEAEMEDKN